MEALGKIGGHWRNGTLIRAIRNRVRKELGLPVSDPPQPLTELRAAGNAHLRELCREVSGAVLSIGEGHGLDKQGSSYRDYFPACDSYVRMEFDEGWGGKNPAEIYADVRSMPEVADASFDCVICIWVLEHIDDVDAAVAEIWRILKPGGVLIFAAPLIYEYHDKVDYWRFSDAGWRRLLGRFTISSLLEAGQHRPFSLDPRLKFYGPAVQSGPLGYIGSAVKPAT